MNEEIKLQDSERQQCEVWTRVMGYYRPVDRFNDGKTSEYKERVFYNEHNK
jgi:anaerobic ribonucleoside-triphosphate reductase